MRLATTFRSRLSRLGDAACRLWDSCVLRVPPRAENPYATHVPVLVALARVIPVRRVLELGCGRYSTFTFLNRVAFPQLEQLYSLENDRDWAARIAAEAGTDARLSLRFVDGLLAAAVAAMELSSYDLILI